jgi:hypothetical protein
MRVRIVSQHPGEVDGIRLSNLECGLVYEVSPAIGTYLITMRCAEPVVDQLERATPNADRAYGADTNQPRDVAADRGVRARRSEPATPAESE